MIHDTDLIDGLVTLIKSSGWCDSSKVADVRRVWGGDVHESSVPVGQILVQLWPQTQQHDRIERAGPWNPTITLSVGFYFRVSSQTMQEVDAALQSYDELLVGESSRELLDVIQITKGDDSLEFVRQSPVTWTVRPDRDRLQRIQPDGEVEKYTGLCQCQVELTYKGFA